MEQNVIAFESRLATLVEQLGYFPQMMEGVQDKVRFDRLPGVVVCPIAVDEVSWVSRRRVTNRCELVVAKAALGCSDVAKRQILADMRRDLYSLLDLLLLEQDVVEVSEFSVEVVESAVQPQRDVRLLLEMDVVVNIAFGSGRCAVV